MSTISMDEMRAKVVANTGVIMVGVSGSGKSTVARMICPSQARIVSTDDFREQITGDPTNQKCSRFAFELAHKMWEARLRFRQPTIFDATSTTNKARKALMELAYEWNDIIVIVVNETLDLSKTRNASRERVVPEFVLDRQMSQLTGGLNSLSEMDAEVWYYTAEEGFVLGDKT